MPGPIAAGQLTREPSASLDRAWVGRGNAAPLPRYPWKMLWWSNCPLELQEAEGAQAAREVRLQALSEIVKMQPKDNCISLLKGFLNTSDQKVKASKSLIASCFHSPPLLALWEHVLTSKCGWKCRKDALVQALKLAQSASETVPNNT